MVYDEMTTKVIFFPEESPFRADVNGVVYIWHEPVKNRKEHSPGSEQQFVDQTNYCPI